MERLQFVYTVYSVLFTNNSKAYNTVYIVYQCLLLYRTPHIWLLCVWFSVYGISTHTKKKYQQQKKWLKMTGKNCLSHFWREGGIPSAKTLVYKKKFIKNISIKRYSFLELIWQVNYQIYNTHAYTRHY